MYEQKNNQVLCSTALARSATRMQGYRLLESRFFTGGPSACCYLSCGRGWWKGCDWSLSVSHPLTDGRFPILIQLCEETYLNFWPLKQHLSKSTELVSTKLNNQQQEQHSLTLVPKP